MRRKLQTGLRQQAKLKMRRRLIVAVGVVSVVALAAAITFFFQFTNVGDSKAGTQVKGTSKAVSFESSSTGWSQSGAQSMIVGTDYKRGGAKCLIVETNKKQGFTLTGTGSGITIPESGTYYITVIAYALCENQSNDAKIGILAKGSGNTTCDSLRTVENISSSQSWTRLAFTIQAANGETYQPVLYGERASNGTNIKFFFDDVVIYSSAATEVDVTAPTACSAIFLDKTATKTKLDWFGGTDNQSGVDGVLILRASGIQTASPAILSQVAYGTTSEGVNTIDSLWTVVHNGTNMISFEEPVLNGTYTYLVYTRDLAFNYATAARAYYLNNSQSISLATGTHTVEGLYIDTTSVLTIPLECSLSVNTGAVKGKLVNYDQVTTTALVFNGIYEHRAGYNKTNSASYSRSVPTAIWNPGSHCYIYGPATGGLNSAVGGLKQAFYNFTWNCSGQTAASNMSGTLVKGNFNLKNTGTSNLTISDSLRIRGNFIQDGGTLHYPSKGTYISFEGSSSQIYKNNGGTSTGYPGLNINNTSGLKLESGFTVKGICRLQRGKIDNRTSALTMSKDAEMQRIWGSTEILPASTGSYDLTYLAPVTTGVEVPTNITLLQTLTINTPGTVKLASNCSVNKAVVLSQGKLELGNNDLTLTCDATIQNASTVSFVVTNGSGALKKKCLGYGGVVTTFFFPVGATATSYTPATVTNEGAYDEFAVRVADKVYENYDTADNPTGPVVNSQVVNRIWFVDEANKGGSLVTLKLQWNAAEEASNFSHNACFIAHNIGGKWVNSVTSPASGSNPYTQTMAGITTFSPFGVGNNNSALPVNLVSFNVFRDGNNNRLEWTTVSEENNDRFEVERSEDGRHWKKIGTVSGKGATQHKVNYHYKDENIALAGGSFLYYRLRQVDFNGKFEYSSTKKVVLSTHNGSRELSAIKAWYNTTNEKVHVLIETSSNDPVQLALVNLKGQIMNRCTVPGGNREHLIDAAQLTKGAYSLTAEWGGQVKSIKFVKN